MLKKCIGDLGPIILIEGLGVKDNLSIEDVPVRILDRQVMKLSNKDVASVKVLWKNHLVEGATQESKADMMSCYPHQEMTKNCSCFDFGEVLQDVHL